MVTREQAKAIAEGVIAGNAEFAGISAVYRWNEIPFRRPLQLLDDIERKDCWIAYADYRDRSMLRSSTIVLIDRQSGNVVHQGSACDEG